MERVSHADPTNYRENPNLWVPVVRGIWWLWSSFPDMIWVSLKERVTANQYRVDLSVRKHLYPDGNCIFHYHLMVWRVWRLYQLYSLTLTVTRLQANWTFMGVIRLVEDKFPPLRFLETWEVKVKMPWSSFRVKRWCAILTRVLTQPSVQAFKIFSSEEYKLHTVNSNSSLLAFTIFVLNLCVLSIALLQTSPNNTNHNMRYSDLYLWFLLSPIIS